MRILGVDFGDVRTGIALSDVNEFLASSKEVIIEKDIGILAKKIIDVADKYNVSKIVLGYPKNIDGTISERGKKTEHLKQIIEKNSDYSVILWDERFSTITAHNILNQTKTKNKNKKMAVDKIAAAIILQSYLDANRG